VRLTWREDRLELVVANQGAPAPAPSDNGGHGLVGMRERVRLHRGELQAGPRDGGGWVVAASLPTGGDE
jgi:signal transduction histidine kinase